MYSEKRDRERIRRNNRLVLRPYSSANPPRLLQEVPARLEDVSSSGICVDSDTEFEHGARARVTIEIELVGIASSRLCRFESDVEVRWIKPLHEEGPFRTGMKFVNTSKVDLQIWADFIGKARVSLF